MIFKSLTTLCTCVALGLSGPALHAEDDPEAAVKRISELKAALPVLEARRPMTADDLTGIVSLAPGVGIIPDQKVVLEGLSIFDKGPTDGLEVLVCLKGGKNHEAFAWLKTGNGEVVKTAFIAALDLTDGQVSEEESGFPARGTPLRVMVRWQPDVVLDPDRWVEINASVLVRDRDTDRAYPPLPWVYTGSQIRTIPEINADGETVQVERFMLDTTKSVAVNFDEPDALCASPFPLAALDRSFEVNSAISPQAESTVVFTFARTELPLTLRSDATGALYAGTDLLDDAALQAQLQAAYADGADLHGVGIAVDPSTDRNVDKAVRLRVMEAAAAAGVWAVPIFMLIAE
jgi:hypothetical protein